jgi:hypothetical protein
MHIQVLKVDWSTMGISPIIISNTDRNGKTVLLKKFLIKRNVNKVIGDLVYKFIC